MQLVLFLSLLLGVASLQTAARGKPNAARDRHPLTMMVAPAWANGEVANGWRGDADQRAEAEEALKVKVSSDPALWEANDFVQYGSGEWKMTGFDRIVLLATFMAFKAGSKLSVVDVGANAFEEFVDAPIIGRQPQNSWVVFGYLNERARVCRSYEGKSFGAWYVQTLEPDATPSVLKYEMMPSTGHGAMLQFERV